jgi:hypothetical protein
VKPGGVDVAWRKIAVVLTLSVAVMLATLVPIVILESRRMPDWQSTLVQYLEASQGPLTDIPIVWVAQAQSVYQFPAEEMVAVPTDWMWQGIEIIPPPDRIYCVRLERPAEWKLASQVLDEGLLVGYHDDGLHHAGWIVHEFRAGVSQGEREELFAKMGCDQWERISIGRG